MTFWRVGKGLADLSPRRLPRHHPSFLRSAAPPLCPALDLSWLLPHPWGTSSGTHLSTPAYSRIAVLASCLLLGQLYFSWLSAFCRFSCISVMWPPQPHYIFSGICLGSWKIPTGNPRPCPCSLPPHPRLRDGQAAVVLACPSVLCMAPGYPVVMASNLPQAP